jgi:hypothetical protein
VALLFRWTYPSHAAPMVALGWLITASSCTLAAAVMAARFPRQWVRQMFVGKKPVLAGEVAP